MDIRELFENKLNIAVIALIICFFVFGILLIVKIGKAKKIGQEGIPVVVDTNMLYLLEEPLKAPPIQFSRKQRKAWQMSEIEWWIESNKFTKEELENLKTKNREMIKKLLDNVP